MIVVTGGAGFIGSNIVAALEARGEQELVVCDWLGSSDKWRNIAKREVADIVPPEQLFDFLNANKTQIRAVFHMGAISATTETNADLLVTNNYTLNMALWRWCASHEVRLFYASSGDTYGDGSHGFDDDIAPEALARLRPLTPHGWSKHVFDRWVARRVQQTRRTPPQWVGLKFFNPYGPNEYHKGVHQSIASRVYAHAASDSPFQLFRSLNPDYPDGGQMRDFIWIGDCVDVMMWLYDNPQVSGLFNLGTGKARSFYDIAAAVYRALGKEPYLKFRDIPVEIRDRYQYFTQANMARLRAAGYDRPFTSLEDGVTEYVRSYLHAADRYR